MPEFQAGAYDPWAGPGYDACAKLTGDDFEDVFYKENWGANEAHFLLHALWVRCSHYL